MNAAYRAKYATYAGSFLDNALAPNVVATTLRLRPLPDTSWPMPTA